uniref:Paramyosin, short form-like n=1 Tax=Diabrotica virgifera virgifera TaxID=50390 RepID=A0A6P7H5U9_DIAVI
MAGSSTATKKWRPQTSAYDYNYGVGINYYQPMVDFIEEKGRGRKVNFPDMPWSDELGLDQFDPLKIKLYSQQDLTRISRETEASAKSKLRDFKSSASSSFVLQKSVSAATITQKVKTETKKKKSILRDIKKIKDRMYDDLEFLSADKDREIERELRASQKFLRGRSAKQIEQQLLSQSNKAIAEGVEEDFQRMQSGQLSSQLSTSGKIFKKVTIRSHAQMMDQRIQSQLEESFKQPLDNLSLELKDFDRRSSHFYEDKR